ncbi:hypothetical protein [Lentzea sp. NPDC003310]|uniref:hypothetical protein n=1 Tax=Lentzea sp. NPDC003310 TaxID=3154447 RepID=UPI0033ACF3C1
MALEHLAVVPDEGLVIAPPPRLAGLLSAAIRVRGEVTLAMERGATMSELASTLAKQDRPATVTATEANGTSWTISFGAVEAADATEVAPQ